MQMKSLHPEIITSSVVPTEKKAQSPCEYVTIKSFQSNIILIERGKGYLR